MKWGCGNSGGGMGQVVKEDVVFLAFLYYNVLITYAIIIYFKKTREKCQLKRQLSLD